MNFEDIHLTQRELADLLGVTQQAISLIEGNGVADRSMDLQSWLRSYTSHLRETAAGRLATGDLDLATERARLAKEQADRIAMQNAIQRRELAPVVLITEVLAKTGTRVAGILEAIPGQVRRRLPDLPASEVEAIQREIVKARNLCASIRLEDLDDDDEAPRDDLAADHGSDDTAHHLG